MGEHHTCKGNRYPMLLKGAEGTAQPWQSPVPDTVKANHPLPKSLTRQVHTPWQEAEVSAAAINEGAKADKKTTDGRHLVADNSYS